MAQQEWEIDITQYTSDGNNIDATSNKPPLTIAEIGVKFVQNVETVFATTGEIASIVGPIFAGGIIWGKDVTNPENAALFVASIALAGLTLRPASIAAESSDFEKHT